MAETTLSQVMELKEKSLDELKAKYEELFPSQKAPSNNKVYLWRRIAYKLQEIEHSGLSAEAQGKIEEFIQKYDPVNNKSLRPTTDTGCYATIIITGDDNYSFRLIANHCTLFTSN
ncbi:MAG: DUF2924 domain-containing protein [Candidatus Omnitrophica bacterium]|nr:DUF2924 domain-containing protein [Candidatus Omnitrophota bacterium]